MNSNGNDTKVLILGIGNVLMGDEGIGVHVVNALEKAALPKGVEIVALNHGDDKPVVSIHLPRTEEEPAPVEEGAEAAAPSEVPAIAQKGEEGTEGK